DPVTDSVRRSAECAAILGLTDRPFDDCAEKYFERIHPDDRERFERLVGNLSPKSDSYHCTYRLMKADGNVLWLEKSGRAVFDQDGKMVRLIGMTADISERKRAEEEKLASEALNAAVLSALDTSIAVLDGKGRVVNTNDLWGQFSTEEEAILQGV